MFFQEDFKTFIHNDFSMGTLGNYKITLQFSGMDPHIGNTFFIRVVDKSSMLEVGRTNMPIIVTSNFSLDLYVLLPDSLRPSPGYSRLRIVSI